MPRRSLSRVRLVIVLAGFSVVASIAMATGALGSRIWAKDSFAVASVVTALVAAIGGFIVAPLLGRLASRVNGRSSAD